MIRPLHRNWYHGSPHELTELAPGSTVTPNRRLARAFSHKPTLLCIEDDGTIRHNGTRPGVLYLIDEEVGPQDLHPHPRSKMPPGIEWLTTRPLKLRRLGSVSISRGEQLTADEVARWDKRSRKSHDEEG